MTKHSSFSFRLKATSTVLAHILLTVFLISSLMGSSSTSTICVQGSSAGSGSTGTSGSSAAVIGSSTTGSGSGVGSGSGMMSAGSGSTAAPLPPVPPVAGSGSGSGSSGGNATNTSSDRDGYTEVDIIFETFSDARLSRYLSSLASAVGVPVGRLVPQRLENALAMEFGLKYVFPLKVSPPTNVSGDVEPDTVIARRVEEVVTAANTDRSLHHDLYKATMVSARRVQAEVRVRVQSTQGVNYTWVAFLLIGLVMLVASVAVLLRPRGTDQDLEMVDDDDNDEEMGGGMGGRANTLPDDVDPEEEHAKLQEALLKGHLAQQERTLQDRRNRAQEAKKALNMLDVTLEYDRTFALPPLQPPNPSYSTSAPDPDDDQRVRSNSSMEDHPSDEVSSDDSLENTLSPLSIGGEGKKKKRSNKGKEHHQPSSSSSSSSPTNTAAASSPPGGSGGNERRGGGGGEQAAAHTGGVGSGVPRRVQPAAAAGSKYTDDDL